MFTTRRFTVAAALGLALCAVPAMAAPVAVQYGDLDLATAQGQKTLDNRLDSAAREACGYDKITTGSRLPSSAAAACYKQAKAQLKEKVASLVSNANLGG